MKRNKFKFLVQSLMVLGFTFFLAACFKNEFKGRKLKLNWTPEIAVPLINTSVSINDVLNRFENDSLIISIDDNNFVTLVYDGELLSKTGVNTVQIPSQQHDHTVQLPILDIEDFISIDSIALSETFVGLDGATTTAIRNSHGSQVPWFGIPSQSAGNIDVDAAQFPTVTLSSGTMLMTVKNQWGFTIDSFEVSMIDDQSGDTIAEFTYTNLRVDPNPLGTQTDSADVSGKSFSSDMSAFIKKFYSAAGGTADIDTNSNLIITIEGRDMEIASGLAVIPFQDSAYRDTFSLSFNNGEFLNYIDLKAGNIRINSGSQFDDDLTIRMEIFNAIDGQGNHLVAEFDANSQEVIDMSGYRLDFTEPDIPNALIAGVNFSSNGNEVAFTPGDEIEVTIIIENVEISYVEGYVGNQVFNLPKDTIDLNVYRNVKAGSIYFKNPKVTFSVTNSFGIPIEVDFATLRAVVRDENGNTSGISFLQPDSLNPLTFAYPQIPPMSNVGTSEVTRVEIRSDNSNLPDIIASNPIFVEYEVNALANPGNDSNVLNFVTDSSYFKIDVNVELPLDGYIQDFSIQDTFYLDPSVLEPFEFVNFLMNVTNEFPFNLSINAHFADSANNILNSLFAEPHSIMKTGGKQDANGKYTEPAFEKTLIEYPAEEFSKIKYDATQMFLEIVFETDGASSNKNVRLFSDYNVQIQLGIMMGANVGDLLGTVGGDGEE